MRKNKREIVGVVSSALKLNEHGVLHTHTHTQRFNIHDHGYRLVNEHRRFSKSS